MKIHDLKPAAGSNAKGVRVGRGIGGRRSYSSIFHVRKQVEQ